MQELLKCWGVSVVPTSSRINASAAGLLMLCRVVQLGYGADSVSARFIVWLPPLSIGVVLGQVLLTC